VCSLLDEFLECAKRTVRITEAPKAEADQCRRPLKMRDRELECIGFNVGLEEFQERDGSPILSP
jgi:hypothetical protein